MDDFEKKIYQFTKKYKDVEYSHKNFLWEKKERGFASYTVIELVKYLGYTEALNTIRGYIHHTPHCNLVTGFFAHFVDKFSVRVNKKYYTVDRHGYCDYLQGKIKDLFPNEYMVFKAKASQEEIDFIKKNFNRLY